MISKSSDKSFQRLFLLSALVLALLMPLAVTGVQGQAHPAPRPRSYPEPMSVVRFQGRYCSSMGPRGWAVIAENPQRVAFGADSMSSDGKAYAGFAVFGTMQVPGMDTPDRAVATHLSAMGAHPATFGRRQQLDRNTFAVSYRNDQNEGMAFYTVFPFQGSAVIVMRQAAVSPGTWRSRGAEASAVARSMHCNVPSVPAAPDPPSLNQKPKSATKEDGEQDSEYNVWLDKEYYHDPQSGQNFWVSPSSDWDQNGPQGPGYYTRNGNDIVKLQSGYAQ